MRPSAGVQRPYLGFQPTTLPQKAARNLTLTQTRIPVLYQEKKLKTISVTTYIPSPPDVVWKILTDFPTYVDWNPFITRASGDPQIGHKLSIRIVPPGGGRNDVPSTRDGSGTRAIARVVRNTRSAGALRWPPRLRPQTHGRRHDSDPNGNLLWPLGATHDRGTSTDKERIREHEQCPAQPGWLMALGVNTA
ncbi:SRPBCC family protein [Arthrobacter sp. AK04]|uniref:SRPBCC family protein n=1 Tax=Arthrobacter sp. AK04 TaxID=2900048 RepID=UPI0035ABACD8